MFGTGHVVWKEGMFLNPQHFQQAQRSILNAIQMRLTALSPYCTGITEIAVDKDALSNELFSLTCCAGVLPDGTCFEIPKNDSPPTARSFADHFPPERQTLDVYLALPLLVEGKANVDMPLIQQQGDVRYRLKTVPVNDEVSGGTQKEIDVASLNFQVRFGDESLDNYSSLRIARLARTAGGTVELADAHVPPILQINASPWLMAHLRSMLQLLMARIASLAQGRRQVQGGFAEFSSTEETAFRLLQTLNTYTPLLAHHHLVGHVHPYEIFCLLNRFAGALCTFSADYGIEKLPRYDHANCLATFQNLGLIIRSILNADISAGCVALALNQINQATYVAAITDEKLLDTARLFLGISAKVPEKELIVGAIQRIKMCSRDRLDLLISSAMPGLQLMHVSNPPEGLSTKPAFVYFALNQQGDIWEGIKSTGSIAFYFPHNYPELKVELLALKG